MLDKLRGIHIETTNMCTLKCPRCSRTEFINQFPNKWTNQNLDLEQLKKFLDIDLTGVLVSLIGNDGDPIYYPQLIELIKFLKTSGAIVNIHTNGSHKTVDWWEQLNELLDCNDIVSFSIDGTPDNFTNYRINANWDSIKNGINVLVNGSAKVVWKCILFSYNESTINEAKELSIQLGMDDFMLINSDRWVKDDWLKPSSFVEFHNDSEIKLLNNSVTEVLYNGAHVGNRNESKKNWLSGSTLDIRPICKVSNSMHFVSARGFYSPCCWAGDYRFYYKSDFYKNKDLYDISKTTLSKILTEPKTVNFFETLEETKPVYCTFNCGKV